MASELSSSGVTFKALAQSSDFLNHVLNNITSCVLLLNSKMELQAYNDALKSIFSNKKDEDLLYHRCGEAIGCAHSVEEMKRCGETSQCKYCLLRESAMISYIDKRPVYKQKLDREFFKLNGEKVMKNLQFSTRPIVFGNEYYIIVILEDTTELQEKNKLIKLQKAEINELKSHS